MYRTYEMGSKVTYPSQVKASCRDCGSEYVGKGYDVTHHLRYTCGGGWLLTVDVRGVPCWEFRCGRPLVQQQFQFKEAP